MNTNRGRNLMDLDRKGLAPTPVDPAASSSATEQRHQKDGLNFGKETCDRFAEVTPSAVSTIASTPVLPISSDSMSKWRRANMKFRKQTIAHFEPAVTPSDDASAANENKSKARRKTNRKKKLRANKNLHNSQIQVIDAKKNAPKVTIRFARTAQEEAEVGAATVPESQQVAALKLKYLGVETKSQKPKYCVE